MKNKQRNTAVRVAALWLCIAVAASMWNCEVIAVHNRYVADNHQLPKINIKSRRIMAGFIIFAKCIFSIIHNKLEICNWHFFGRISL